MGTRPAGRARAEAERAAQAVTARRIQALKDHEKLLGDALAEYFEAKTHGEKIRADAKGHAARLLQAAEAKAEKLKQDAHAAGERLTEQAEKDACDDDARVGAAVRRLLEIGETKAAVAEITGLQPSVVRAIEREKPPPTPSSTHSEQPTAARTRAGAPPRPGSPS